MQLGAGKVCVEGAFHNADGTAFVDVDNPRVWDSALVRGVERTETGVSFQTEDRISILQDGDGPASSGGFFASDTSGPATSVDAMLTRIPVTLGSFGTGANAERINFVTPGIRIGHQPVTVTLRDVPNRAAASTVASFRMALNPAVLLVPVQVFTVFSAETPELRETFSRQDAIAIFDRAADLETGKQLFLDSDGRVEKITLALPALVLDGDARQPAVRKHVLPDDVWAQCGVQFRLVNYTQLEVPAELTRPRGHARIRTAVEDLLREVRASPRDIDTLLTVIVAPYCSDVNAELFPPPGQALVGDGALCVRSSSGATVLAHEIGHIIMSSEGHADCTTQPGRGRSRNLMCAADGGYELTAEQCARARDVLQRNTRLLKFPRAR